MRDVTPSTPRVAVPGSKLRPPRVRHAEVTRTELLDDRALDEREILAVAAPAGYGKSTLAIQWASRSTRPVVWLTVDETDNDPLVLMNGITAALNLAVAGYTCDIPPVSDEPAYSRLVVPGLLASFAALPALTMVIDDVHHIRESPSVQVLRAVVDALPVGSQVALVGRDLHALPIALWRGQGRVADIRSSALTFSPEESLTAVRNFGKEVDGETIHEAASGWPVAVYLLSQARSETDVTDIEEFIEAEVLGGMDPELRQFVLATAPLGTVNAGLAADVAQTRRAGHFLAEAITTVLMQPTDGGWFCYHPLLQESVTAYLEREDPSLLSALRVRAARWHLTHGHLDAAVRLAIASDVDDAMGHVVWESARPTLLNGRARTVRLWLERIDPATVDRVPALSLTAAWTGVATGQYAEVLRHGKCALHGTPDWPACLETTPFGGHLAILQAVTWLDLEGPREAAALAARACDLIADDDPVGSLAVLIKGLNRALLGDPRAQADMHEAVALAKAFAIPSTEVEAKSILGLYLLTCDQESAGCDAIERARSRYAFHDLSEMASSSGLMALARVALASRRGREPEVRAAMEEQAAVREGLEAVLPWYGPLSAAVLAEVSIRLGDTGAYRQYLAWCDSFAGGEGLCRAWAAMARQQYAKSSPLADLTPAELRVWELLKGRMTLSEIAGTLYLSRETVKSHTGSIYRKLGVASRREAQELAETWA